MRDENPGMWTYWRDEKGFDRALRDYYPETVAADPRLQQAMALRRAGELLANEVMQELADKAEGGSED